MLPDDLTVEVKLEKAKPAEEKKQGIAWTSNPDVTSEMSKTTATTSSKLSKGRPSTSKDNSKSKKLSASKSKQKKPKKKAAPVFVEPVIKQAPKVASKEELYSFLNSEKIAVLRPQAKVVAIMHSSKK